eukprot:TRINITY_DN24341_c0_g1_i1.p1 TRINITY_DN24341_c0_g1~~TRINITY_DN24341_c0_g1_i1.p1  ORF type:complete len:592 (+),score=113.64 TRINITY_DN24341_c0_g1_i1:41-1816(+)
MKNSLLVAAGAGAVVGAVAAKCFANEREADDGEDLLEAAFSVVQNEPNEVQCDIIDMVIREEEDKRQAEILRMSSITSTVGSEEGSPLPEITGSFSDKVNGVVSTDVDGSRVFSRPEVGLEFKMSKAWYGLDEYAQPQESGATWVARFGDPTAAPTPMARQLVLIVEQVGDCTIEEYAAKSKLTCQETMGSFSKVNFTEDCPFSIGPFKRKLVYTQVIPAPNMMIELKFLNYMTVQNGIAYTLQLMAPADILVSCVSDMDETARNMKVSSCRWKSGSVVHTKALEGGDLITANVPLEMIIADEEPPSVLTDAFQCGGDFIETFVPLGQGFMVSYIYDRDSDISLKQMNEDKLPEGYKILMINSPDSMLLETLVLLPNNEVIVTTVIRHTPKIRIVAWSLVPDIDANNIPDNFFRSMPQISMMQTLAITFAEGSSLNVESKPGTYYTHPAHGFSFTISPKGLIREHHFGEIVLQYSYSRESQLPELQVLRQNRSVAIDDWLKEVKQELTQAGGVIDEETHGHLGRESMKQLVIRVPQQEAGRPVLLKLFVTLVSNTNGAYMFQWRTTEEDFQKHRDQMEDVVTTFKFFPRKD